MAGIRLGAVMTSRHTAEHDTGIPGHTLGLKAGSIKLVLFRARRKVATLLRGSDRSRAAPRD